MAVEANNEKNGYIFQWKIEHVFHWWWLKKGEGIESPVFIADDLEETKWTLWFYPMEEENESNVGIYLQREKDCNGPDVMEVNYQFAFLAKDGSILKEKTALKNRFSKNDNWGFSTFEERERVFVNERELFLPEDTLNVQCTIWVTDQKPFKSNQLFATSVIKVKRRCCVWSIDKPHNLISDIRNKFRDYLIACNLLLYKNLDRLRVSFSSLDDSIKYISCSISIIDTEERKENCGIKKYFADDLSQMPLKFKVWLFSKNLIENRSRYFPNDVLSLDFEFVLLTVENSNCRGNSVQLENEVVGNEKFLSQNTAHLIDDLYSLYSDAILCDTEIRTFTKTFPVHKNILSARSPVFLSMFSRDMKEKNTGVIDIPDFDDDTIDRMLLYIYSDSLKDLKFESAYKLYKIANKYQILSLQNHCSSFLIKNLCATNACDILILADLHTDDDLKRDVQDYILRQRKQIFCSKEWKDFMRSHLELAADIMYMKLTKSRILLSVKDRFSKLLIKLMANALIAYNMRWKIENISHCLWLKKGEGIESPTFVVDAWEGTRWSLLLFPLGDSNGNCVGLFLKRKHDNGGPDIVEICYQLSFLSKDGSILKQRTIPKHKFMKNENWGFHEFESRERVFVTEREACIPEDTLTVQSTIWVTNEKPDKSNSLFATTVIKVKRRSFEWKIDSPSNFKSSIRNKFKDNLIDFDLVLSEGIDKLDIDMISFDKSIKYFSYNASVIDSEGRKKILASKMYYSRDLKKGVLSFMLFFPEMLMENKNQYFSNDVLSLDFEFVLATLEHSGCRLKYPKLENEVVRKEKFRSTAVPIDDFKSLYNDGIFSDTELRTSTKTFPVHKSILSVRSPVFRSMFSHDMKEKNSGYVDITDFDDETVHRMLLYIYTDTLEGLQFESASKLYKIADKYQILSLKSKCSTFLKENLCPTNACDALVLADVHNDNDLKTAVQDYILLQHKQVFCSEEWEHFMNTYVKLAADLMYRKITKSKMYLPRKRKSE
ncbi:unnamed protein product [Larinioides sclopetarius]|uniref:Speckle-type POZ protein n=1 Tax=Larinioides sclopetarius TaxID=280406 RepID=A0AAV2BGM4_9ARAC